MYRAVSILMLILFAGCQSNSQSKTGGLSSTGKDSVLKSKPLPYSKKSVDSLIRVGAISPDSLPDLPPTQEEEREKLASTYNNIKVIDSTFINQSDTLHFHSKYYCLKNVNIVEPKRYDPDEKNPKEFITHPFVSDILLIHNRDTVLKRQFQATDLNPFFEDNFGGALKKYGSILNLNFARKNKDRSRIVLDFQISIPATDLGLGKFMIISKNGDFKFTDSY